MIGQQAEHAVYRIQYWQLSEFADLLWSVVEPLKFHKDNEEILGLPQSQRM